MQITIESKGLSERKIALWVVRALGYLLYAYLIVVELILVIGFLLLLFGANPTAGFTQWAYRNLDRVMAPFRGIFTPIQLGTTSGDVPAIFDTSILFAMIIYGILALALSWVITWLSGRLRRIHDVEDELQRRADADAAAQEYAAQQAQFELERDARARALVELANQQAAAAAAPPPAAATSTPAGPTSAPDVPNDAGPPSWSDAPPS